LALWTIPWGRLENGESPAVGALREVYEEAGIKASVDGLLGMQELPDPQIGWLALVHLCRHISGDPVPDNRETDAARYLTIAEMDELSEPIEPWSDWLMKRVLCGDFTLTLGSETNPYNPKFGFV
jgi:8-oxo-dGTP diphosphatase